MTTALAVRPEFARSVLYMPDPGHIIKPEGRDGSQAVHAPLEDAIRELVQSAILAGEKVAFKVRMRFGGEYAMAAGVPEVKGRKLWPIRGGAASAWTFTNTGRTSLLNGDFDIDSDSFKMALFLSTSNLGAASTTYAGVTNEVANAFGYTTGGIALTMTLAGTTTVTATYSSNPVWTASGGSITARFAAIYEVSGKVLCYCTLDSTPADVTATDANTLTIAANGSGVFTLA